MQASLAMNDLHFITVVWGEEYTDIFLKVTIPSQLSRGNLPSFCYRGKLPNTYKIYTTSKDAEIIQNTPVYSKLSATINTEIHLIDDLNVYSEDRTDKYDAVTICYGRAIAEASKDKSAIILLWPDAAYADGTFANLQKIAMTGKRVVAISGIRTIAETFIPTLLEHYYSETDFSLSIPPRELVKLSLEHIHPESRTLFWDSSQFNGWPAYLYWDVNQEGVLQRGMHFHPLMIIPLEGYEPLSPAGGLGIDGLDYIARMCPDYNDVYVVEDSDEIYIVAVDHLKHPISQYLSNKSSALQVASWARKYANSYHLKFFGHKIRYHYTDLSPQWEEIEQASDKVVDAILACLEFFEKVPDASEEISRLRVERRALTSGFVKSRLDGAFAYNRLGEELYKMGRVEEAEAALLKAYELVPNLPEVHNNLAVLYWEYGNPLKADEHIRRAVQLNPQNPDAVVNCALIQEALGETEQAIQLLEHYLVTHEDEGIRNELERMRQKVYCPV
jgi:tetratricopeptide (TPR) repeat protein